MLAANEGLQWPVPLGPRAQGMQERTGPSTPLCQARLGACVHGSQGSRLHQGSCPQPRPFSSPLKEGWPSRTLPPGHTGQRPEPQTLLGRQPDVPLAAQEGPSWTHLGPAPSKRSRLTRGPGPWPRALPGGWTRDAPCAQSLSKGPGGFSAGGPSQGLHQTPSDTSQGLQLTPPRDST